MFGEDWDRYIVETADAQGLGGGGFWRGELNSRPSASDSPLPSSAASLGTWSAFATAGSLKDGAVGKLLETQYRTSARLYYTIGRSLGFPRGAWLNAFQPVAAAGSMSNWAEFPAGSNVSQAQLGSIKEIGGIVVSALNGQWAQLSDEEQFKLIVGATLGAIDVIASTYPAVGPVVDLATDLIELGIISQVGDATEPKECDDSRDAAELSAEADMSAVDKILDRLDEPGGSSPDLTDFFSPPGEHVYGFPLKFVPGTVMASSDACGGGIGAIDPDPYRLGFIPGTTGIHQGFQATGDKISFYHAGPWTEIGNFFPTANCLMSRIWSNMQQSGPLMFCVNADIARDRWAKYLGSYFDLIRNGHDTGSNMDWRAAIWDSFAVKLGFALWSDVWGPPSSLDLDDYFAFRRGDGSPVDLDAVAWGSLPVVELGKLRAKQNATLETKWAAYISYGFSGVQGLDLGASRWWDTVQSLISAPAHIRATLDAENIALPELRQAVIAANPYGGPGGLAPADPGSKPGPGGPGGIVEPGEYEDMLPNFDLADVDRPPGKSMAQIYAEQGLGLASKKTPPRPKPSNTAAIAAAGALAAWFMLRR